MKQVIWAAVLLGSAGIAGAQQSGLADMGQWVAITQSTHETASTLLQLQAITPALCGAGPTSIILSCDSKLDGNGAGQLRIVFDYPCIVYGFEASGLVTVRQNDGSQTVLDLTRNGPGRDLLLTPGRAEALRKALQAGLPFALDLPVPQGGTRTAMFEPAHLSGAMQSSGFRCELPMEGLE